MYRLTISAYQQDTQTYYSAEFEREANGKTQRLTFVGLSEPCSISADPLTHGQMLEQIVRNVPGLAKKSLRHLPTEPLF